MPLKKSMPKNPASFDVKETAIQTGKDQINDNINLCNTVANVFRLQWSFYVVEIITRVV